MKLHPDPLAEPIACGNCLDGVVTSDEEMALLINAGLKFRSFKYWHRIRIDRSEQDITGSGFNCVKFDPRKPARTIRKNDGQLGMHGAMHWTERRRFSLSEMKRFGSFPDAFVFPGKYEHGVGQIGNCVPPLFMRAIAGNIRRILGK